MPETLSFDTLNELLTRDEMAIDAAELHGSLCAQASVSEDLEPGHWLGRALGREVDMERLSADLQQALQSQGEDEEQAYAELSEYARVGAMLVFETLRGPDADEAMH